MKIKYSLTILSLILGSICADAQNIVPNSNFASHSSCPSALNQLSYCDYWRKGNFSSTDYYNACDTGTITGVPNNLSGFQNSPSGSYAGIVAFYPGGPIVNYQEYLATSIPPLVIGSQYKVAIVVSLADYSRFACAGLGVLFFKDLVLDTATNEYIPLTPQINYSSYGIITDKSNWVTLTDTFTADSSYTNLVIGNFTATSAMDSTAFGPGSSQYQAYYYVDSVAVERIVSSGVIDAPVGCVAQVVPNPVAGNTPIKFPNPIPGPCTIILYDALGRKVVEKQSPGGDVIIFRSGLPAGVYLYRLVDNRGNFVSGKVEMQ